MPPAWYNGPYTMVPQPIKPLELNNIINNKLIILLSSRTNYEPAFNEEKY